MTNETAPLRRKLGFWMCTALVMGNMIGSGIFLLPASLAPFGGISIVGWLISAAGAAVLAIVFARLSRIIRQAGGPYAFTRAGFGEFPAFLVAWGYWIACWTTNSAIAVALVSYLSLFVPALATSGVLATLLGLVILWGLTWVNCRAVYMAGQVQLVTTILKVVPLVLIGAIGLFYIDVEHFKPFNPTDKTPLAALTATVALTLWAFLGLESGSIPADDVEDPQRTIGRATIVGTFATAVVYILGTVVVMGVIPASVLAFSNAPFADAATKMWGGWAGYAVGIAACISCFGALNGWILLAGQIPLAAARDGLFPDSFARVSKFGTPAWGLVFSGILSSILLAMNYTKGLVEQFTFIILLATLNTLIPYVFCSLAEIMMWVRDPQRRGRPETSLLLLTAAAFLYSLWAIGGAGQEIVYWGFLLLMAGVPVYAWIQWTRARAGS
jgi:APA family basic amino acid/polyamine antiporter